MGVLRNFAKWLFVLCLPVLLFTASLAWGFNSLWLYKYGFQKFGISQATGIPESELDRTARALINYFNSSDEFIQVTVNTSNGSFQLFNPEEQFHFRDVKGLVRLDYWVLLGTFTFALVFGVWMALGSRGRWRRAFAVSLLWGCGLTILLLAGLAIASLFDFSQLFVDLHYLIFSNSYWSAQGYMLLLFPGDFWFDAVLVCFGFMAALALILGSLSTVYLFRTKRLTRWHGEPNMKKLTPTK